MKRQQAIRIRLLLWILFIFILCSIPVPATNTPKLIPHLDKLAHWGLFFFLGAFLYSYIKKFDCCPFVITLLFIAFYGGIIEWLQETYFSRTADFWDWVADVVGGITGILLYPFLYKMRRKYKRYDILRKGKRC